MSNYWRKRSYPAQYTSKPKVVPGYVLDGYAVLPSGERYRLHSKNDALYIWPNGYGQFSRKLHFNGHGAYIWWYGKTKQVKLRIRAHGYRTNMGCACTV